MSNRTHVVLALATTGLLAGAPARGGEPPLPPPVATDHPPLVAYDTGCSGAVPAPSNAGYEQ
jgi:hypothetical protein